jgi:hypothetical protein
VRIVAIAKGDEVSDYRANRVIKLTVQEQGIIKYNSSSCYMQAFSERYGKEKENIRPCKFLGET